MASGVSTTTIRKNGYVLTPGRYMGAQSAEDDGEPSEEEMQRLTAKAGRAVQGVGAAGNGDPSQLVLHDKFPGFITASCWIRLNALKNAFGISARTSPTAIARNVPSHQIESGLFERQGRAGKMNFYLSAVDDLLKHAEDGPSIGIVLCKENNNRA